MTDSASIRDILDFWFLPLDDAGHGKPREIWWKSTPEHDEEIRGRFGALVDKAIAGDLDSWRNSPDGALALAILCDQFTRNIHRRTIHAYSGDAKARETARFALARNYPAAYVPNMRMFFYTPFHHSEELGDQELCCTLFAMLGNETDDKYAIGHRNIVARFGRFPHRNEVMGRTSTAEELDYLKTADRFGQ
ncbi:MAG: DUF924 domain-containing protein [Proteobacteria bacterium]|nr:DUF924 domain-containing protein [Pseudomonadota bacterium]